MLCGRQEKSAGSLIIAGADGCPIRSTCIRFHASNQSISSDLFATAKDLIYQTLMIDVPIALSDSGQSLCDQLALPVVPICLIMIDWFICSLWAISGLDPKILPQKENRLSAET